MHGQADHPDRVIVKFRPGASPFGDSIGAPDGLLRTAKKLPGESTSKAIDRLQRVNGVEYAEPDYVVNIVKGGGKPSPTVSQWALANINIDKAWTYIDQNTPSVSICVIDTGVDYTHEDLQGQSSIGFNAIDGTYDGMDDSGHGTHCAGIIAATVNNSLGIQGIGYNKQLLGRQWIFSILV